MDWSWCKQKSVLKTIPFEVEEIMLSKGGRQIETPYHRLISRDWVNVLPVTEQGDAILIRQFRAGSLQWELETPGGCYDPGDLKIETAVSRELEEETGYVSSDIVFLGSQNPNSAIHGNQIHFYLALNCRVAQSRVNFPDENEDIEIVKFPVSELKSKVLSGEIQHSLCSLCVLLASEHSAIKKMCE